MRVLQAIWDGGGNVPPQLAITRELVARGHEVIVLGHRVQRAKVEATGARFAPWVHAPDHDAGRPETDMIRDWEARTPPGAFARNRDRLMFGPAATFARDVLDVLDAEPADVIAWDFLLMGAGLGAERAGVGSVALVHTPYPFPAPGVPPFGLGLQPGSAWRDALLARVFEQTFRPGLKPLNAARRDLGLAPLETPYDQVLRADRVLVLTAAEFDPAGRAPLPEHVRFVGPPQPAAPQAVAGDPPLVLVSFSTTFMDQRELYARAIGALGDLPVRGLVTTGPAVAPAALPSAANVEVREFVPHAEVLPAASLVVTHAGLGTVHAALAHGVPLVCVPQGRDQPEVASRVVQAGAGVRTNPKRLAGAIGRVLGDGAYREAALALAPAMSGGAERAADAITAAAAAP